MDQNVKGLKAQVNVMGKRPWLPWWLRSAAELALSARARQNALSEWRRRCMGEPSLPNPSIRRVLVVCQGNICRSPFAAALIAHHRRDLELRSAGLEAGEGVAAHGDALRAAQRFGVDLGGHRARRLEEGDVAWADLILAMEGHQAVQVAKSWPSAKMRIRLLGDFLPAPPFAIGDPFGQGDATFAASFERIALAVERMIPRIERKDLGPP